MIYPTGALLNLATGRYHPIYFKVAPMPGMADAEGPAQRYKSGGHHTEGFATFEEAKSWVATQPYMFWVELVAPWDGEEIPTMHHWFNEREMFRQAVGEQGASA